MEQHNTAEEKDSKEIQQVMCNKQSIAKMKMTNYPRVEQRNTVGHSQQTILHQDKDNVGSSLNRLG